MAETKIRVSTWTPPRWMNSMMRLALRTPGLQRLVGRAFALISFTGRRSGRRYTTPVSYFLEGDRVVILTKRFRRWWRNLADVPRVELRLAGRTVGGVAAAATDAPTLPALVEFLENRPGDARFYGVPLGPDGKADEVFARALLEHLVVVTVSLDPSPRIRAA